MKTIDELSYCVIGCAMRVYKALGPGLLESVYEKALVHELVLAGISVHSQVAVEVNYRGINIGEGLRVDLLVDEDDKEYLEELQILRKNGKSKKYWKSYLFKTRL